MDGVVFFALLCIGVSVVMAAIFLLGLIGHACSQDERVRVESSVCKRRLGFWNLGIISAIVFVLLGLSYGLWNDVAPSAGSSYTVSLRLP